MSVDVYIRRGTEEGTISFEHGGESMCTTCWWDLAVEVDSGDYVGYATRMASKTDGRDGGNREAIWLGSTVPVNGNERTSSDIFIHKGASADASDGCIVCDNDVVLAIWDAAEPKEEANVNIHISDV